jgi:hypothetical protein
MENDPRILQELKTLNMFVNVGCCLLGIIVAVVIGIASKLGVF